MEWQLRRVIDTLIDSKKYKEKLLAIISETVLKYESTLSVFGSNGSESAEIHSLREFQKSLIYELNRTEETIDRLRILISDSSNDNKFRSSFSNVGSRQINITVNPMIECATYCKTMAAEFSQNKANSILNCVGNLSLGEEFYRATDDYKNHSQLEAGVLLEVSKSLNDAARAFCETEAQITSFLKKDFEEPRKKLNVSNVQFSAVSSRKVENGDYIMIDIFMYEDEFRYVVDQALNEDNTKETNGGYNSAAIDSNVRIVLTSSDIEITEPVEERIWKGKYQSFSFAVEVPDDYSKKQILFNANIYIDGVITTRLKILVACSQPSITRLEVSRQDILSAFVSYASQDRNRVASIIQGMKKARPDLDVFFDVESLRSGQAWENALKKEIENRDVLFLCWSEAASKSKWVDMEWRYALSFKGEEAIEPIPIDSPDICPPPTELQGKHFNDKMLYIIKATDNGLLK